MVGPEENCQIQCPKFWDHLENAVLGSFVARLAQQEGSYLTSP